MILFYVALCTLSLYIYQSKSAVLHKTILVVSFVLSVLAFFQDVNQDSDLMVAFEHLDNIRRFGWSYFKSAEIATSYYFTGRDGLKVYFYLLSLMPCNNFFSAVSVFLFYYLPMLGFVKCASHYNVSISCVKWCLILLIWMVDFFDGSNGVRNMLSFGIFAYAVMGDLLIEEKKVSIKSMIYYVVAALIHSSAWILVALRLVLYVKKDKYVFAIGVALLFWSLGVKHLNISELMGGDNAISGSMEHHVSSYAGDNTGEGNYSSDIFNNSASYMLMRTFRLVHVLAVLFLMLRLWKKQRQIDCLMKFVYLLSCFCLGAYLSSFATNIFTRYSFEMIFLTPVFLACYNSQSVRHFFLEFYNRRISLVSASFLLIILLFNYYQFRYHYHYMHFGFNIY